MVFSSPRRQAWVGLDGKVFGARVQRWVGRDGMGGWHFFRARSRGSGWPIGARAGETTVSLVDRYLLPRRICLHYECSCSAWVSVCVSFVIF